MDSNADLGETSGQLCSNASGMGLVSGIVMFELCFLVVMFEFSNCLSFEILVDSKVSYRIDGKTVGNSHEKLAIFADCSNVPHLIKIGGDVLLRQ